MERPAFHDSLRTIETSAERAFEDVTADVRRVLEAEGFTVVEDDLSRPWGGFFRIANEQAEKFIDRYFPGLSLAEASKGAELSPKILIPKPGERLSWQYHDRRAERWVLVAGEADYYRSDSDEPGERLAMERGVQVQFEQGERHRLCGARQRYGLVAEIWQHTDPDHPSDEDDIVRLQDDYRRTA